ncbi:hypothetical protein R3P38DRAFT_2446285, partial [Favolaschia claudopus]
VLANMDDPWLSQSEIDRLIDVVVSTGSSLEQYLQSPPPPHNIGTRTIPPSGRGRPRYALDIDRAIELHDMGNTWAAVAGDFAWDGLSLRR